MGLKLKLAVILVVLFILLAGLVGVSALLDFLERANVPTTEECEEYTDTGMRDACYDLESFVSDNPAYCDNIMRDEPASALKEKMVVICKIPIVKNGSVCTELSFPAAKDDCYNFLALELKDPSYCDKIKEDESMKSICKEYAGG